MKERDYGLGVRIAITLAWMTASIVWIVLLLTLTALAKSIHLLYLA